MAQVMGSNSSTSSSLDPSSASPASASSFARRSLRRKQRSDPLISSSNAASTLFPRDYLEQEAKAKRISRKLAEEYQRTKEIPTQEAMNKLNIYHEILRDKIINWSTEVSDSLRVEIYEEKVRFLEYPVKPHGQVTGLFHDLFTETFGTPFPLQLRPFISDGTTDVTLLNGEKLLPDVAFRLWNPRIPGVPTQPTGEDYPCIVFEMANSERLRDMLHKCEIWLSDQTRVNVWIGVNYERTTVVGDRTGDRWWMGVARRDFNAIAAGRPANIPVNALWPPPIWLFSMPHAGRIPALPLLAGPLELCSTVQNVQWVIPIADIIHPLPQIPPPLPPPSPQQFPPLILHPEVFRTYLVRNWKP